MARWHLKLITGNTSQIKELTTEATLFKNNCFLKVPVSSFFAFLLLFFQASTALSRKKVRKAAHSVARLIEWQSKHS